MTERTKGTLARWGIMLAYAMAGFWSTMFVLTAILLALVWFVG